MRRHLPNPQSQLGNSPIRTCIQMYTNTPLHMHTQSEITAITCHGKLEVQSDHFSSPHD